MAGPAQLQGYIVVITRSGSLGGRYPVTSTECLFGQSPTCDVRVYVANVARKHCRITCEPDNQAYLRNINANNITLINGSPLGDKRVLLQHADVITVGERLFRWEYPVSSNPVPVKATPAKAVLEPGEGEGSTSGAACMVQLPLSVFKNKRHSAPGVVRENKIISLSTEVEEPSAKRRKTLANVTDLAVENELGRVKPVNKRLLAVTQPASSPKTFNTFRVLLKSASKRKSHVPVSKTPKSQKKVIASKIQKSKSLSPKLLPKSTPKPKKNPASTSTPQDNTTATPKQRQSLLKSRASSSKNDPLKNRPMLLTPLKGKTPLLHKSSKSPSSRNSLTKKSPEKSTTSRIKSKSPPKTPKISIKSPSPKKNRNNSLMTKTPAKTPKGISESSAISLSTKKPRKSSLNKKTPGKTLMNRLSLPTKKGKLESPTKSIKNVSSSSSVKIITPGKTPRGRPVSKSLSPMSSRTSSVKIITPGKKPKGWPVSPAKSLSPKSSRTSSPVKTTTPGKKPRGRPVSPAKSPSPKPSRTSSPVKTVTPGKKPRGRPVSPAKSLSPKSSRTSSPVKTTTPGKKPRGRPVSPAKSPSPKSSRTSSPVKTVTPGKKPRGRPVSQAKSPSPKSSRTSSPVKIITPGKKPRGRPVSPAKSPSPKSSRTSSPVKTITPGKKPRGRPVSAAKSPSPKSSRTSSPVKTITPGKTPRGRPVSPAKSPSPKSSRTSSPVKTITPGKTPRGRPISPAKSPSPKSSRTSSPVKTITPGKKPRGRPVSAAKSPSPKSSRTSSPVKIITPGKKPRGRPVSPAKSLSPKSSRTSSLVKTTTPGKTPRERPVSPTKSPSSRTSSPVKTITPGKKPRGRPVSLAKSPSPKSSRTNSPEKTITPGKTGRGRSGSPAKSPQPSALKTSPVQRGRPVSPAKSPSPKSSRTSSLVKTKTPSLNATFTSPEASESEDLSLRLSSEESSEHSLSKTPAKSPRRSRTARTPEARHVSPTKSESLINSLNLKSSGKSVSLSSSVPSSPSTSRNNSPSIRKGNTPVNALVLGRKLRSIDSGDISQSESFVLMPTLKPVQHTKTSLLRMSSHWAPEENEISASESRQSTMRSRLSPRKSLMDSISGPLSLKSSTKKDGIAKLQSNCKRKQEDFEAKAERAAKRLKMETPKSLSKNKVAALLVCHGRSPKNIRGKPLFSDILKSHLSTAKKRIGQVSKPVVQKNSKEKSFTPALVVPKSFNFTSTGHVNSPETIVIRKKTTKTPAPKTRKGRKSAALLNIGKAPEQDLTGVQELFKTPTKTIVSSLKTASSMKKPSNARVRFSLQNDVQSPSGRSSIVDAEHVFHFESPAVRTKRYYGTPKSQRISEASLLHMSIAEESHSEQESVSTPMSSGNKKSRSRSSGSSEQSDKSYNFSAYSPTSPTLQFSEMSGISSVSELDGLSESSPISESEAESPKRKRSLVVLNDSVALSSFPKKISFARSSISQSKKGKAEPLGSSPDQNAKLSKSDLFGSSVDESNSSRLTRASRRSDGSVNTSGVFRLSLENSQFSNRSPRNSSGGSVLNVSQIPLPPSPSVLKHSSDTEKTSSSLSPTNDSNISISSARSTRSNKNKSVIPETPGSSESSVRSRRSKSETFSLTESELLLSPKSVQISKNVKNRLGSNSRQTSLVDITDTTILESPQRLKRVSSTPKPEATPNLFSPITSPIVTSGKRSSRSQSTNKNTESNSPMLEDSSAQSPSVIFEQNLFKTPLPTPGRKSRKSSTRMSASNTILNTLENQVPVATVKPSTRKNQINESTSSVAESVSLPNLSISQDVSGRSLDRNLATKMLESRTSRSVEQLEQLSPTLSDQSNSTASTSSSTRRKRKSSSMQSLDATAFDFSAIKTPNVPKEMFISPLTKDQDNLTDVAGVKRVFNTNETSPMSSYSDVKGVKRLLSTPKPGTPAANYTSVQGIKELFHKSPVADYTDTAGVKRLYGAPTEANYLNVKGVRRIFKETKTPNSPDVSGVQVLFESPKKTEDDYSQPSTSKPVVMVSPMSRSEVEVMDLESEKSETRLRTSRTRPSVTSRNSQTVTIHMDHGEDAGIENASTSRARGTRRTVVNIEIISEEQHQEQPIELKSIGRRGKQKDLPTDKEPSDVKPTKHNKSAEKDKNIETDCLKEEILNQLDYEPIIDSKSSTNKKMSPSTENKGKTSNSPKPTVLGKRKQPTESKQIKRVRKETVVCEIIKSDLSAEAVIKSKPTTITRPKRGKIEPDSPKKAAKKSPMKSKRATRIEVVEQSEDGSKENVRLRRGMTTLKPSEVETVKPRSRAKIEVEKEKEEIQRVPDTTEGDNKPLRARRGRAKDTSVEKVDHQSSAKSLRNVQVEDKRKASEEKEDDNKPLRARRGRAKDTSIEKVDHQSAAKSLRNLQVEGKQKATEEEEDDNKPLRARKGKGKDRSVEKIDHQSPAKPRVKSRKDQVEEKQKIPQEEEDDDKPLRAKRSKNTSIEKVDHQSPAKSRSRVRKAAEISEERIAEFTKPTRARRGQKSEIDNIVIDNNNTKTKNGKGKKISPKVKQIEDTKPVEGSRARERNMSIEKIEDKPGLRRRGRPAAVKLDETVKEQIQTKSTNRSRKVTQKEIKESVPESETNSVPNEKIVRSKRKIVKEEDEGINKSSGMGKTKTLRNTTKKTSKSEKKKESTVETSDILDKISRKAPSTSQSRIDQRSQQPPVKTSRRVQFNSKTPEETTSEILPSKTTKKTAKVVLKTKAKADPKGKAATKRKSNSPSKDVPAKRITRARK